MVKINRRLIKIALACMGAAIILTFMLYSTVRKVNVPEETVKVAYFKSMIEKDTILKSSDVTLKQTPVSLVPKDAIKDASQIEGKRLLFRVLPDEMAMPSKIIDRGDNLVDVKELWTVGLDVANISNFLGGNIKEGKYYALLYRDPVNGNIFTLGKVKVAGLVDANSKIITRQGDAVAKTINISVESPDLLKKIAKAKGLGNSTFELVDAPEGKEIPEENFDLIKPTNTAIK